MTQSKSLAEARKQFKAALEEKHTVKMLVFGADDICAKARIRADANPARQVIAVPSLEVLTDAEKAQYLQNDDATVVCVLTVQGIPVEFLSLEKAQSTLQLERAFLQAQKESGK